MKQPEFLQPSWPYDSIMDSSLNEDCTYSLDMDFLMGDHGFSSSFSTNEDSSDISSFPSSLTKDSDELFMLPVHGEDVGMFPPEQYSTNFDLGPVSNNQLLSDYIEDVLRWMEESESDLPSLHSFEEDEGSLSPSTKSSQISVDMTSVHSFQPSLDLPQEDMEIDNQLNILHLLEAYGEAMGNKQAELAEVIMRRITEKASPSGTIVERLAYYLFQSLDMQGDYIKQESSKNHKAAFRAFYQIFPYGRFAHFTANNAILEAVPEEVELIHIVDFDMGEGVQWPSLIEALGRQRVVRLTSVKRKEDCNSVPPKWTFQETKRQLCDHAQTLDLKLRVEEMEMEELVSEIRKMKQSSGGREFLAFNCLVDLPHMGRGRNRRDVMEFLRDAKNLIGNPSTGCSRGIIVFGDGDGDGDGVEERITHCCEFGSFFYRSLVHFHALLESMEWQFLTHLTEARIAMECLFVAPYLSSLASFDKWEEIKEDYDICSRLGLQSWGLSRENLLEAKEIVREGKSLYGVKVEGENKMVLEWRGTPLVRVSTWR